MKRQIAENILDATKRIDTILAELGDISWEIEDEAERKNLRAAIGECIFVLYNKLTREVALDFPDLHPDFPDGGWPGRSDRD
jgi:hypothetical protein